MVRVLRRSPRGCVGLLLLVAAGCTRSNTTTTQPMTALPVAQVAGDPVMLGRKLVIDHDCGACHGGDQNPASEAWLRGARDSTDVTPIGACALNPGAKPCFFTRARNLTPDNMTGLGRFSERQIFNALRFGLRPGETPDVEITGTKPGEGNFPMNPKYMAPPMPWPSWRHMSDEELWAIAAYLKRGLKPAANKVPDSDGPPDFWASEYTVEKIGRHPAPAFPTEREVAPTTDLQKVLLGRKLVLDHACGACHGGAWTPAEEGWLAGMTKPEHEFLIGPCFIEAGAEPCWRTRPRNLTPDNTTGLGRFSERQIFNALRFGLRPGETPDVEITGTKPGEGNFPMSPKYLAPPMPWPAWRFMSDEELWAIAAYLKRAVKPVSNKVMDSEGPADFWAEMVSERVGPRSVPPFPTANEVSPKK